VTRALDLTLETVEPDRLLAETQATAARLARRSPVAIAALKRSASPFLVDPQPWVHGTRTDQVT
jgi:enoyl-CoA hydratase/carnithine racemase